MRENLELVAFDVDGTLIRGPDGLNVWEILNRRFIGDSTINRQRLADYLAGRISYAEWVELDVIGWRDAGADRPSMIDALGPLRLVSGAREALDRLKQAGLRLIVISGTLDLMLNTVFPDHPFEEVYANHVGFDAEGAISHWRATPFDMSGKAQVLRSVALREGIPLERCAFVGDSSNDTWVARVAGLTVAFNPNCEELQQLASVVVRSDDLRDILPHLLPDPAQENDAP